MKFPSTMEEWFALAAKAGWALFRVQIIGMLIGGVVTLGLQSLTGFWDFRAQNQVLIRKQYEVTVAANKAFEAQLVDLNKIFIEGRNEVLQKKYSKVAQAYISELQATTSLLPSTESALLEYIDAMSLLNKYYAERHIPAQGTEEWVIFYGGYRTDFDKFILARQKYMAEIASELQNYKRFLVSS